jgi:hypothetical protein
MTTESANYSPRNKDFFNTIGQQWTETTTVLMSSFGTEPGSPFGAGGAFVTDRSRWAIRLRPSSETVCRIGENAPLHSDKEEFCSSLNHPKGRQNVRTGLLCMAKFFDFQAGSSTGRSARR